jgi:DNA-binding MarR family transcriptional regulator
MLRLDRHPGDARRRLVRLTEAGREAVARDSVLDPARVAALLARLSPADRRRAVDGLKLLGEAARQLQEQG